MSIHAPREFSKIQILEDDVMLVRKNGSTASLRQLSTGQRTALAISVFLVMNSMLRNGPRLLIFDDPVTYVDDLNLLSFLDHLRELS